MRDQLNEKRQQVEEIQAQLAKREEEVQAALQKYDFIKNFYNSVSVTKEIFFFF